MREVAEFCGESINSCSCAKVLEFRIAELTSHLQSLGYLDETFIEKLQRNPRADPERAKKPRRLTSPASLLVDFGYTLGGLVNILDAQTTSFDRKMNVTQNPKSMPGIS
jgi:hypothetical protein